MSSDLRRSANAAADQNNQSQVTPADDDYESDEEPEPAFVDSPIFNFSIGMVITANAAVIGLEADYATAGWSWIFTPLEYIFCVAFTGEIAARVYCHYISKWALETHDFQNWLKFTTLKLKGIGGWDVIDVVLVVIAVGSIIMEQAGGANDLRMASMLRIIRMMRLVRLIRLLKVFKELWLIINGLFQSVKTLGWVVLMMSVFIYVCAIFCTLVVGHEDAIYDPYFQTSKGWDHEEYFGSVPRSMFTLFQVLTLDRWSEDVARHVIHQQPAMLPFFLCFVGLMSYGLLNIIVGVIVENTLATAKTDMDKVKKSQERQRIQVLSHLREVFEAADADGSNTLSLDEVKIAVNKPEIYNKLKLIDFPVEEPDQIFILLDGECTGEVAIKDFINGCLRMKGVAKSKDLLEAQISLDKLRKNFDGFEEEMMESDSCIRRLEVRIQAIIEEGESVFLDAREFRKRHPEEKGALDPLTVPPNLAKKILQKVESQQSQHPAASYWGPPDDSNDNVDHERCNEDVVEHYSQDPSSFGTHGAAINHGIPGMPMNL